MKKGFTFIELILFVICTSVLVSFTSPILFRTHEEASRNQCRSNMIALATGEALYYEQYDEYGAIINLENTGIMPGATSLMCSITPCMTYIYTQTGDTYTISCPYVPGTGTSEHGYINTGVTSWEN